MATGMKANRRAFTLIEVLVVVAIIALLISILLPSLKQARELSRLTVCLSKEKQMGNAMTMYFVDNKDVLPGPIHPMFLIHPEEIIGTGTQINTPEQRFTVNGYINTRLRKYMGDKSFGKGSNSADVCTDPSFPIPDAAFKGASGHKLMVYHYAINSSQLTAPWQYFGFTHGGIASQSAWDETYGNTLTKLNKNSPKKLSKIFAGTPITKAGGETVSMRISPDSEWMFADAFRRPLRQGQVKTSSGNSWPASTESGNEVFSDPNWTKPWAQNEEWGTLSDLVSGTTDDASAQVAPSHPYHMTGGVKLRGVKGVFYGKTATAYFDGHCAPQEGWSGTKLFRGNLPVGMETMRD